MSNTLIIEKWGFTYRPGQFLANGMGPMPEAEIRALIQETDPKTTSPEAQHNWKLRFDQVVTMDFLQAQCKFYGIYWFTTPFLRVMLNLLRNGLEDGKCRKIPERTKKYEAELRADYEKKLKQTTIRRPS
ncbi:hypothetical protein V8F33_010051 [Rhypophila sp. PSN 637]